MSPKRRTVERRINSLIAGGVLALPAALAASPALAAKDYPPGLFENSPVVPSGPRDTTVPSGPPDAAFPFGPPPDGVDPLDDYCAGVPFRTFRSLAEVRRAHAQCRQRSQRRAAVAARRGPARRVIGMASTGCGRILKRSGWP